MTLPDRFKCIIVNWEYIYNLCRDVSSNVKDSDYQPELIIALARGGWFAGRVMCDFLGLDSLTDLRIEHHSSTITTGEETRVMYPLTENAISGKRVLIIDDILDTGKSVMNARDHILQQEPQEVRTAALQYMYNSQIEPDYCGEHLEEWAWIVYPWNFIKDMTDIVSGLMERENIDIWDIPTIKHGLYEHHAIDPVSFEVAQPGRLTEILDEMERRGMVETIAIKGQTFWKKK